MAHKSALVIFSVLSRKVRRMFPCSYDVFNLLENDTDTARALEFLYVSKIGSIQNICSF